MTSVELGNLVRIGRLKREPAAATEIKGLIRSGELRLALEVGLAVAPYSCITGDARWFME